MAREVTKVHEEFVRGTISEVLDCFREHAPRGEVTIVVAPDDTVSDLEYTLDRARSLAKELLDLGEPASSVVRNVVQDSGLARNLVYRIVHDLKDSENHK